MRKNIKKIKEGDVKMNNKQKVSLVGFIIGLIMIFYWGIYDNKFALMAGFTISLVCSFLYSIFEYFPDKKVIKDDTEKGMI